MKALESVAEDRGHIHGAYAESGFAGSVCAAGSGNKSAAGTDDFAVKENRAAGDKAVYRLLGSVLKHGDVGIGSGGEVSLGVKSHQSGSGPARFKNEFFQGDGSEFHE